MPTMTKADLGLYAEHNFAAEAFRRGYRVSFAPGGIKGYDVVLDNGSRLLRVQVKGSRRSRCAHGYHFVLGPRNSQGVRKHVTESCDVFAFWLDDERIWIFEKPEGFKGVSQTTISTGRTRTNAGRKRRRFAYGNWDIFDEVTQSNTGAESRAA